MPYVPVPKDLTKVKTKVAAGLTKRQLICFSLAALVGLPVYFLTRGAIGNSAAVLLMIGLMMPFFFFAMYEKDGQPAEKLLRNRLRYKLWPKDRPYRTEKAAPGICKHFVNGENSRCFPGTGTVEFWQRDMIFSRGRRLDLCV